MAAARSRGSADETRIKPRSDAYVGLLGLSLLALTAAMLFAYLNWSTISEKPKQVQMAPAGGGAKTPPPPSGGPAMTPPPAGAPGMNAPPPPGQTPPGNNQQPAAGTPPQQQKK